MVYRNCKLIVVAVIAVDYPHLHGHFVHNKQVIILAPSLRRPSSLLTPLLVVANVAVFPESLQLCFFSSQVELFTCPEAVEDDFYLGWVVWFCALGVAGFTFYSQI